MLARSATDRLTAKVQAVPMSPRRVSSFSHEVENGTVGESV
jgi:hypothetical protein